MCESVCSPAGDLSRGSGCTLAGPTVHTLVQLTAVSQELRRAAAQLGPVVGLQTLASVLTVALTFT